MLQRKQLRNPSGGGKAGERIAGMLAPGGM